MKIILKDRTVTFKLLSRYQSQFYSNTFLYSNLPQEVKNSFKDIEFFFKGFEKEDDFLVHHKAGIIEVKVKELRNNQIEIKNVPIALNLDVEEEVQMKEKIKKIEGELQIIKDAVGFLIPVDIKDHNFKKEKPRNLLDPIIDKLEEKSKKRVRQYEEKFFRLEEKIDEHEKKIGLLKNDMEAVKLEEIRLRKQKESE